MRRRSVGWLRRFAVVAACAQLHPLSPPPSHPPEHLLDFCVLLFLQGLAFVKQRKAGVLGGWNWGDAMVVQRLPDGSWSAPCFLRLRYGSLGLTLGMQSMRSVYVLQARGAGRCGEGRGGGALVPAAGCMQCADVAELGTTIGSWLRSVCLIWFLSRLELTGPLPAVRSPGAPPCSRPPRSPPSLTTAPLPR